MEAQKFRFLDFETLPHWWCISFGDFIGHEIQNPFEVDIPRSIKDDFVVITSDMPDARAKLLEQLNDPTVIISGYNIKHFDLIIANAIYQGCTPEQVFSIAQLIINPDLRFTNDEYARLYPRSFQRYNKCIYQDLFGDHYGNFSLKHAEMILGLSIQETSVPFDKEDLTEEDKKDIIDYNKHDVYSTIFYYQNIRYFDIEVKGLIGEVFNIDKKTLYASSNGSLTARALGCKKTKYDDEFREDMVIPENLREYVFKYLPDNIIDHITSSKSKMDFELYNNIITVGNGGLHSVYKTDPNTVLHIKADDNYGLAMVDGTSMYPSMMIAYDTISRSIINKAGFKEIFDTRVRIKHKPKAERTLADKQTDRAYKKILNTTYGASGNSYLDAYDLYNCSQTCRIGQFILIVLGAMLTREVPGLSIIQSNTDGILIYYPKKDKEKIEALLKEYEKVCLLGFEWDEKTEVYQRDVNNYVIQSPDGSLQAVGDWLWHKPIKPGYNALMSWGNHVSAKAVLALLFEQKNPIEFIKNDKNIGDFIMQAEKGVYAGMVSLYPDGREVPLHRSNRVIAVKPQFTEGSPRKYKYINGVRGNLNRCPSCPEYCKYMNGDFRDYDFDRDVAPYVDYDYYINDVVDKLNYNFVRMIGRELVEEEI